MRALYLSIIFIVLSSFNTYKKVYIEWIDIVQMESGWHYSEEIDDWVLTEQDTVKQIGFLYRETKSHIIIIDSYITKDFLGTATKIPKCNIIYYKEIK